MEMVVWGLHISFFSLCSTLLDEGIPGCKIPKNSLIYNNLINLLVAGKGRLPRDVPREKTTLIKESTLIRQCIFPLCFSRYSSTGSGISCSTRPFHLPPLLSARCLTNLSKLMAKIGIFIFSLPKRICFPSPFPHL